MNYLRIASFCLVSMLWMGCNGGKSEKETLPEESAAVDEVMIEEKKEPSVPTPDWASDAVMYEVNVRQYSKKGTLKRFTQSIPRLKNMGVDILWFMPIQPIGKENRKGSLGSYYSIADYTAVNPEFGTMDDFKETVRTAHSMGMKVILDWVANHSAFDNPWAKEHPEWYTQDENGNIIPPNPDWSDVADLNYENQEMRRAMIDAMRFWIEEADVDGFRCDVAGEVPMDFWEPAIEELRGVKEIFMLAEWDEPEMHSCFNATYAWGYHHQLMEIGKGEHNLDSLRDFLVEEHAKYPADAFKLRFTTNHDENTWKGTEEELFGPLERGFQAMMYCVPGMPLMYSGQESGLDQRLEFFERDPIQWKSYALADFFTKMNTIKAENPALHGGVEGGEFTFVGQDCSNGIIAFDRIKGLNHVRFIMNGTNQPQDISSYLDDTPNDMSLIDGEPLATRTLEPHGYLILQMVD